jgi:hypothetical protein
MLSNPALQAVLAGSLLSLEGKEKGAALNENPP